MANRSFVRDTLGRFAKSAGRAATREAKKFAAEAAADAKRVAKAKANELVSDAQSEVAAAKRAADAQEATRSDVETDSDAVDFEIARKRARDALRKAKVKLAAAKVARAGTKGF